MRIALLQYPIVWADPKANLGLLNTRLMAIQGQAEIAVVPEMFSTGFCTDRPDLAEPWGGETCQALQQMADRYEIAIMGSIICYDEADKHHALCNRGFMFRPHQEALYVDKRHLYKHGGEANFFRAGNTRDIWEYKGVRIRLAVCYDLRFPVWLRQEKENLYDILVFVACWPTIRIQYWDAMLAARAAENQCYVVGVNIVGTDGLDLDYNGHSVAYDTHLKNMAPFADYEESTRIVDFSIERLRHFRQVLPLWEDGDEYKISTEY